MKRILCILGKMDIGGAETFLMKILRTIDRKKYMLDFLVSDKGYYDEEIKKYGGKIYYVAPKTSGFLKNFKAIKNVVKSNNYYNVLRISQTSVSCLDLLAAKKGGAKNLIFRSSNSNTCTGGLSNIAHLLFRPILNRVCNIRIAPSKLAGEFMFGKKSFTLINNGVDIQDYRFDDSYRSKKREELGISSTTFVCACVGRFNEQKNHSFLLKTFSEFSKDKDTILLIFGAGSLEKQIKNLISTMNIEDKVKILPPSGEINKLYSIFDLLLMPSLYEGMPNVAIESQCSYLECLLSDKITKECKINNNVFFLPILDAEVWSKKINEIYMSKEYRDRNSNLAKENFDNKGFTIQSSSAKLMSLIEE